MLTLESLIPSAPKQRFSGINRTYTPQEVHRLRGSLHIQHTLADAGANRLWARLHDEPLVAALDAVTGNQAMQTNRRTSAMQTERKLPGQAKSFSPNQTKLTAIILALAVIILLVLASLTFGPVLVPGTNTGEDQWFIGP